MTTSTILSDNGATSGSAGLKTIGGNDGTLVIQTTTAGGTATTAMTLGTDQSVTFAQAANLPNTFGFKNRIINGAMMIDQRNAGASVTIPGATVTYTLDRFFAYSSVGSKFSVQQNAGAITPPAGFSNYLGVTSLSAYVVGSTEQYDIGHRIEGFNFADFGFGTGNAKPVTLSFWVYSSLTGTFGGSVSNNAVNRCYVFSYSIPVANTWTYITITIPGDTTGTWVGATNGIGLRVAWGLGDGSTYSGTAGSWGSTYYTNVTGATSVVGTNGATFYITGVQLEKGSTATSFDYRPYGTELALCQRYYETSFDIGTAPANNVNSPDCGGFTPYTTAQGRTAQIFFKTTKRATPTFVFYRGTATATNDQWGYYNGGWTSFTATTPVNPNTVGFNVDGTRSGSFTAFQSLLVAGNWAASAEL